MHNFNKISTLTLSLLCILVVTSVSLAQWGSATLQQVTSGAQDDELFTNSIALDAEGTLHIGFYSDLGGDRDLYYSQKPIGGNWSQPVMINESNTQFSGATLAVQEATGTPYVLYLESGALKLSLANNGVWEHYALFSQPGVVLFSPALAVDSDGQAHVAFVGQYNGEYKIWYGYWTGPVTNQFITQNLQDTQLGAFGSGASPDICVRSNGSVAICYRGGGYLNYQIDVIENYEEGGMNWTVLNIPLMGYQCYPGSIKATSNDDLHLAFQSNGGFGFPNDMCYASKPVGASSWTLETDIGGILGGSDLKLAMEDNGTAHTVCMETSGNFYTGNIIYATNLGGSWNAQILLQGNNKYYPSLLVDGQGNGSLTVQQEVSYQDNDVYYYGYVAPIGPPPELDVTLTPESDPVVIPISGGWFDYTAQIRNVGTDPAIFDGWVEIDLQGGGTISPVLLRQNLNVPVGGMITRELSQYIPGGAPAGNHTYRLCAGYYPNLIVDSDEFLIVKPMPDGPSDDYEWTLTGWEDAIISGGDAVELPTQTRLNGNYPNPFNPSTVISYQLQTANIVRLSIYDVAGQQVAELVDGWREAGSHAVTFDASRLSSGVYIYRMQAGNYTDSGKMILLK